jgi:hypothetical protein
MQHLKKIPFFLFLLVLFFCLHGSIENYGFLDIREVALLGLMIAAGVSVLFLIVVLFTRNYLFAALISFFISLWYLFFGAIYDWIKSTPLISFLGSYPVILPLLLVATIAWIIYLRKYKGAHLHWVFYLNWLMIIYCGVDGIILSVKYFAPAKKKVTTLAFDKGKIVSRPDVYYLLFDEYPGYKSLKDSFGFANDGFYSFLHQQQFRILPITSNYDNTLFSMSSILNMEYIERRYDTVKPVEHDYQTRINEIRNGSVFSIFKSMGYGIRNYSIFDINDQAAVSDQNSFLPVHIQLLSDKILHNRLIRTMNWLFITGKWSFNPLRKKYLYQHDNHNRDIEKMVRQLAAEKKTSPVFCYAHFMMPHGPYYTDSVGNYFNEEIIATQRWVGNKTLFLGYLQYTNTVIESLVDIISSNDPGAIIIIMSDHGKRDIKNEDPAAASRYNNICAVRFPDNNYEDLHEKFSAVNFFRYVFNCEYGQYLPYVKDSIITIRQ